MDKQSGRFEYTYSAPTERERSEIVRIRRSYEQGGTKEDGLARLRKLDKKVKNTAAAAALSLGISGCLVFGLGLTMILEWSKLLWGSVTAALGVFVMLPAFSVYKFVLKRGKRKYGKEILRLSKELLDGRKEI